MIAKVNDRLLKLHRLGEIVRQFGQNASLSLVQRQLRREGCGLRTATVLEALAGARLNHYEIAECRREVVRRMGPAPTYLLVHALRRAGLPCHPKTARLIRRQLFGPA